MKTTPAIPPATPKQQPVKRKVALIGTATQWQLAPFDDPEWEIWGIFGTCGAKRLTRLYELHDKEVILPMAEKHHTGKYWEIARSLGKNYITKDAYDQAPKATRFDFKSKLEKYGPYFASSASWMIAQAIDEGVDTIGMWGINMSSDSEYAYQKPSCTYLLGYARAKGINVVIPDSSELLSIPYQYGIEKMPRALAALELKKAEIQQQLNAHKNNEIVSRMGAHGAEQALSLLEWVKQNWK